MSEIQGKPVFGVCACKEKVQVLSVDQVIDLIQQMAANDWQVPEDYLPKTSVNGIVEQNSKDEVKLWVGTQAQYDALTVEEQSKIFAIISDDPTSTTIETTLEQHEQTIENINERLKKLGFNEGSVEWSDTAQNYIDTTNSSITFKRQGNYVFAICKVTFKNNTATHEFFGTLKSITIGNIPQNFSPKLYIVGNGTIPIKINIDTGSTLIEFPFEYRFSRDGTIILSNPNVLSMSYMSINEVMTVTSAEVQIGYEAEPIE